MKVLHPVQPTSEQLTIIQRNDPGVTIIRGAAGSGKTTTALLRMKFLAAAWKNRHRRLGINRPVELLVITYNRTLRGYIQELVNQQIKADDSNLSLKVSTFAKWACDLLCAMAEQDPASRKLEMFASNLPNDTRFIIDEVQYARGRFLPEDITAYLSCERTGRGRSPRCDRSLRRLIIDQVIAPYTAWKQRIGISDFNDLAVRLAQSDSPTRKYDVVIVDEAHDLSANEVRALQNHLADTHTITYILDGAQRIYAKGFSWREVGLTVRPRQVFRLETNHRNTREIAAFVRPLLDGVEIGDDGMIPNLDHCVKTGQKPSVIVGRYSQQLDWAIRYIRARIDLAQDSVAFLKPQGGKWFDELSRKLFSEGLGFVTLTRAGEWPQGDENIALSTMHSAKGLEFDHVIVLGLNKRVTPHGVEPGDVELDTLRRLVAMALGRARKSIVVGYKPNEASSLVSFFEPGTFKDYRL